MTSRRQPVAPPKSIRVGPFRYRLIFDRTHICTVENGINGVTSKETGTIYVDPMRAHEAVLETVLHEVLHGVLNAGGNRLTKIDEHDWIYATAPILLDTLRRNPQLTAYLCSES